MADWAEMSLARRSTLGLLCEWKISVETFVVPFQVLFTEGVRVGINKLGMVVFL